MHKPRGTICFLNAPLAEFAVPMYRNQASFSGPCSKNTEKKLKVKYQDLALRRGCAHICPVFQPNYIRDFLVSNLPELTKQPTQGWPNTASKHVKMLFLPFSLVILHCLRHVCCHDYLCCFLLKNYP